MNASMTFEEFSKTLNARAPEKLKQWFPTGKGYEYGTYWIFRGVRGDSADYDTAYDRGSGWWGAWDATANTWVDPERLVEGLLTLAADREGISQIEAARRLGFVEINQGAANGSGTPGNGQAGEHAANGADGAHAHVNIQDKDASFDAMMSELEVGADAAAAGQTSVAGHDSGQQSKANGHAPEFDDPPPLEAYADEPKANGFKKQTGSHKENRDSSGARDSTAETNGQKPAADNVRNWKPPVVHSYGASFDPSKIPLRQWIIGDRRSLGEVTCDAGPPGVNKSTLMLSDAVSIVSGRSILADQVHMRGEVLILVGEDKRRDVEVRLAGIMQRYNITAAELTGLHIHYSSEWNIDADYTLASMVRDIAVLNHDMVKWLAEFPNIIAVFIDPMQSWHNLIENSNDALRVLMRALRIMATQGNRHVGFDHHVTKASMMNSEAHVGNLAAVRGGGAITGDVRWGFTMAKITAETAQRLAVPEEDRWCHRRLDPLKASYGPDGGDLRLLKVEGVRIANGEHVGVLVEVNMQQAQSAAIERKKSAEEEREFQIMCALVDMLECEGPCSTRAAGRWLVTHRPHLFLHDKGKDKGKPLGLDAVRDRVPGLIGSGLDVIMTDKNGKRPNRIIWREGPHRADELAFEDSPVPAKAKSKARSKTSGDAIGD